jgi:hypothetical protein
MAALDEPLIGELGTASQFDFNPVAFDERHS